MAKKSFKDNPALNFISSGDLERYTDNTGNAYNTEVVHNTENTQYTHAVYKTDTTHNANYTQNTDSTYTVPEPRAVPERKTRRLNLLMRPSLLADVAKIAHMRRQSVNDLINTALEQCRDAGQGEIAEYDRVFGE